MSLLTGVLPKRRDPNWDLEGRGVRRHRALRRLEAILAWIDLGAMLLLAILGPHAFRLAFLS